jgi:hypothetical protein
MKAFADVRMTMILERHDALRRDAARARLVSRPTDGFVLEDDLEAADVTSLVAIPNAPDATVPSAGARAVGPMLAASGGHAQHSSGDCGEGAVAA